MRVLQTDATEGYQYEPLSNDHVMSGVPSEYWSAKPDGVEK